MVICLERGADLHTARLMPLTVSCFTKIQIGFTFLVPAHLGSPGKRAVKRVCMYVYVISRWTLNLLLGITAAVLPAQVAETGSCISFRDTIGGDTLLFRRSSAVARADEAVEVDSCQQTPDFIARKPEMLNEATRSKPRGRNFGVALREL